nr:uncharacterized protein LOC109781687 [Aegilops tauschii subsp. strangulata]
MTSDADVGEVKGEVGVRAACPKPPSPNATEGAAAAATPKGKRASGEATTDSPSPEPTKILTDDVRTEHPASAPPASSNSNKGRDCSNASSESTRSLQSLGGAEAGSKDPNRNEVIGTDGEGAGSTPVPSPD